MNCKWAGFAMVVGFDYVKDVILGLNELGNWLLGFDY